MKLIALAMVLLVWLVATPGCATVELALAKRAYKGPPLPKEKVAFIKTNGFGQRNCDLSGKSGFYGVP